MRMQNAEMEFVTFDAQDVITTSTPTPPPETVKFSGTLAMKYNDEHGGFDFGQTQGQKIQSSTKIFGYDIKAMPDDNTGTYWRSYNSGDPADAELLTNISAIENWLKAWGYTPHQ